MASFGRPAAVLVLGVLGLVGCAPELEGAVKSADPGRVKSARAGSIVGAYVPAGEALTVRLDDTIGTDVSYRGQPFDATVLAPLVDAAGRTVVPAGARVTGEVVTLDAGPSLTVRFNNVESPLGISAIEARVLSAEDQRTSVVEPSFVPPSEVTTSHLFPNAPSYSAPRSVGGPAFGYYARVPNEGVRVPAGTTMRLQLTRPLLAPGSHYANAPSKY